MVKTYTFLSAVISLFLCLCFTQICIVKGQASCMTPSDTKGLCINILNCQPLLDLLKQSTTYSITYLQNSTCGFEGIYPLVCCQENGVLQTGQTTPKPTTDESSSGPIFVDSSPENTNTNTDTNTNTNTNTSTSTRTTANVVQPTAPTTYKLLRSPNCGISSGNTNRVVNGEPAKLGEFPWMAALGYRNSKNPETPRWLCAGTLITDKHILTAGHCTYNRTDLYLARLGELDLYSNEDGASPVDVLIDKIKLHEDYNPGSITNDIAILTLVSPASGKYISPICLPLDEPLRSQEFVRYYPFIAGWGAVYFDGPSSSHLMVVMLPVVSNDQCRAAYNNFKNTIIGDRSICAGYTMGGKDACQGDSGGPLMLAHGQNPFSYYQIGIVSYGFRCAEEGIPGVYSRVTYFLDWIEKNVN